MSEPAAYSPKDITDMHRMSDEGGMSSSADSSKDTELSEAERIQKAQKYLDEAKAAKESGDTAKIYQINNQVAVDVEMKALAAEKGLEMPEPDSGVKDKAKGMETLALSSLSTLFRGEISRLPEAEQKLLYTFTDLISQGRDIPPSANYDKFLSYSKKIQSVVNTFHTSATFSEQQILGYVDSLRGDDSLSLYIPLIEASLFKKYVPEKFAAYDSYQKLTGYEAKAAQTIEHAEADKDKRNLDTENSVELPKPTTDEKVESKNAEAPPLHSLDVLFRREISSLPEAEQKLLYTFTDFLSQGRDLPPSPNYDKFVGYSQKLQGVLDRLPASSSYTEPQILEYVNSLRDDDSLSMYIPLIEASLMKKYVPEKFAVYESYQKLAA